jgi:hypothetical protein
MKHMFFLMFTLVSVLLFLSLSDVRGQEKNPFEGKPDAVKEGEEIFKKRCLICHGEGGKGDICPDLTDKEWKYGNAFQRAGREECRTGITLSVKRKYGRLYHISGVSG